MLTAWTLVTHFLAREGLAADLVQREATIRFAAPVRGALVCRCLLDPAVLAGFRDGLRADGRARLAATVTVDGDDGTSAAELVGGYTAIRRNPPPEA